MFSLPQTPPSESDPENFFHGLPLVSCLEGSHVLELLFAFCGPSIDDPELKTLSDVIAVLEAARKYEMSDTIEKRMRASWSILAKKESSKRLPLHVG